MRDFTSLFPASPADSAVPEPSERLSLLRLARTPGIGPVNFSRLIGLYGTAERALDALPERVRRAGRADIPPIPSRAQIEDEIAALETMGARMLLRSDPDYPLFLTLLPDAPPLLFIRGDSRKLSLRSVSVVGARNASAAAIRFVESLSAEMAGAGLCVVSGLARGIDTAAHRGALHRGLTVAALAGGLDHVYPPENARLQAEIAERGCLISEMPVGTVPQARHFPRRNRLIAGIAQGCLIVEAALRSGTLITARLASSYDRTLFAVPGSPLDPRSRGGNDLIRQGAVLVESAQDILHELPAYLPERQPAPWTPKAPPAAGPAALSDFAKSAYPEGGTQTSREDTLPEEEIFSANSQEEAREKITSLLSVTPIAVDDVVRRCQFSVSATLTILTELELEGIVEFLPGGRVALVPNREAAQGPSWQ